MNNNYPTSPTHSQAAQHLSDQFAHQLHTFLHPLLRQLHRYLDRRLVQTFAATLQIIIAFRHCAHGLLLSELGGYLLSPAQAPAGTKRLSNLLRSPKWNYQIIERFLWRRASQHIDQLHASHQTALVLWDESVIEKSESLKLEGLCAVRSSRAARLKRIKPGYYNPPGGPPVFVPGMQWLGLLVVGLGNTALAKQPPCLAAMRWWTSRGERASDKRSQEWLLLAQAAKQWKRRVLHIFDRGFAGGNWLGCLLLQRVRFVVRWTKTYKLRESGGREVKTWQVVRGKRSWDKREVWDARRREWRKYGVLAAQVHHPHYDEPMWLVVARPGKGRSPWYLLTSEVVENAEQAWQIVFAYARRWQIEMMWRYCKSELGFESPRLHKWENRLKLLMMASLAYAFLLSLMVAELAEVCQQLLRNWCHRTGQRWKAEVSLPLYRLRAALSQLWQAFRPPQLFLNPSPQFSG